MKEFIENPYLYYACVIAIYIICILLFSYIMIKSKKRNNKKEEDIEILEVEEPIKEKPTIGLESLLEKMQMDLNNKEDVVDTFEKEQEEQAIISYNELLKNIKNEPFFEEKQESLTGDPEIISKKVSKFKNTTFISPIYGKLESEIDYPTIKTNPLTLDKTNDMESTSDEIKKNTDFLSALKEFRKNL